MTARYRTSLRCHGPTALLLLGCAATGLIAAADGDIFWHLAAGREVLRTRVLLDHDVFSISAAGRAWPDVHWLFQLGAYGVHSLGGLQGLVLAKCALIGASAWWLCRGVPRGAQQLTALLLLAALLCVQQLLLLRPVIVSLLLLSYFFAQLEAFRRGGRARVLWPLPFAQIVWSNTQGLFALGPAMIAAYTVAAAAQPYAPFARESLRRRREHLGVLLVVLAVTLLAACATPYGLHGLGLPLALFSRLLPHAANPYQAVAENVPPWLQEQSSGQFWQLRWLLVLLAGACAIAARRRRLLLSHALLLAGFLGLALLSNRNQLLLYVMASPVVALQLHAALRHARFTLRGSAPWTPWLWRATTVAALALVGIADARESSIAAPAPFHFPIESARAIAAHGGRGDIFCADVHGGYLIWTLYPAFRPFVDTRWILRSAQEFKEYLKLAEEPQRFAALQRKHAFAYALLPVGYPDRYLGLIAQLYRDPAWRLVYTDGSQVLFACSDLTSGAGWDLGADATSDHVLAELSSRYADPRLRSEARLQFATLTLAVGEADQAARVLASETSPSAQALLGRARLLRGDLDGAQQLAERALHTRPADARSWSLLAQVAVRRGQLPRGIERLRHALTLDPFDAEASELLTTLEERAHEP
jgi:tetratricopeptide (TPR) repeat protein